MIGNFNYLDIYFTNNQSEHLINYSFELFPTISLQKLRK